MQKRVTNKMNRSDRFFAFLAVQQCLNAQSARISSVDTGLGTLVLIQAPVLLYVIDRAITNASLALYLVSVGIIIAMALALVALVFIYGKESPEAVIFAAGLRHNVDATIDESIDAMTSDFEANQIRIRSKARALRISLVTTAFLVIAAAATRLIHF
jgi:hypothetical protein